MHGNVLINGGDQLGDAAEYAALQPVGRNTAEKALDHVEPGRGGWREMDMETRMLLQPLLDLGMLVRRIVVTDQMQGLALGRLPIDLAQEVEPFDMAVTLRAPGDHLSIQRAHGGKQGRRTVALVIVGHRFGPPFLERQTRLGTIPRLNLAFSSQQSTKA